MRGVAAALWIAAGIQAATVPGRYIVELSGEPVAGAMARTGGGKPAMRSAAAGSHRARVRSEQRGLRRALEQRNARVLESADTVANALFVEIPDEDAAQLASMPGVRKVYPVRTVRMLLDRALEIHRVAEAWSRPGGDRRGEGIKVGIIDTGIEASHPGLQDPEMKPPDGFPQMGNESDRAYTTGKVIVARSYVHLLPARDSDLSARDRVGHGTALAMMAAGVRAAGPLATVGGIAPKAWLGNYKVFGSPGANNTTTDDVVIKAIDDAVADGMDVINLSLGSDIAPRLEDDPEAQAIERAVQAGVIVVVAAGNNGSELNTIASPATAPSAITVGATTNDRTFGMSIDVPGLSRLLARPGNVTPAIPITAPLADVAALDSTGLACEALPDGSLSGKIGIILRGTCTFETKLNNAQRAGAVAGLVYATSASPDPISMSTGAATLPAEMVSHSDGMAVRAALGANPALVATMSFTRSAVPIAANRQASFSATGPNVDIGIKPDLVAVGADVYTATQTLDSRGDMYSANGFVLVDGTSFSAPAVAGAAAVLKSARPGLTVDQYRSLLINSTGRLGSILQRTGAGLLDLAAALDSKVAASPVSIGLGAGGDGLIAARMLTLTNTGGTIDNFVLGSTVTGGSLQPSFSQTVVRLAPGALAQVPVSFRSSGLTVGSHEGFLTVTAESTGVRIAVPYWYAVRSGPAVINVLRSATSGARGSRQRNALLFRVTDAAGVPLPDSAPEVTVVSGGGDVVPVQSRDRSVPGLFAADVILGAEPGPNVFRVKAGGVEREITITGR